MDWIMLGLQIIALIAATFLFIGIAEYIKNQGIDYCNPLANNYYVVYSSHAELNICYLESNSNLPYERCEANVTSSSNHGLVVDNTNCKLPLGNKEGVGKE